MGEFGGKFSCFERGLVSKINRLKGLCGESMLKSAGIAPGIDYK
jgi:hypothetical protein